MKKIVLLLCAAVLSCNVCSAQIFKKIFGSKTVNDVVNAVTSSVTTVSPATLEGTWHYVDPALSFGSDNAVKNATGVFASSSAEKKLQEYYEKAGINPNTLGFTFDKSGSFVMKYGSRNLKGTYSVEDNGTVVMTIGKSYLLSKKMDATAKLGVSSMDLLFPADKILAILSKMSSFTDNQTLQAINSITSKYDDIKVGFTLSK